MTKEYAEVLADLDDLDKRRSQIEPLAETAEDSEIEERSRLIADMESRYASLLRRKSELEAEERAAEQAAKGGGKVITTPREEERKTMDIASAEYRDAFYANLMGAATDEQRAALITVADDAVQIPKTLDDKIWDNIHTVHPILNDIDIKNTGVILEVNKHTAITAGAAKKVAEGAANVTAANTFAKVTLAGNDYSANVELSYASAKMSQGALEDYLAEEIAADLGDALAADVFARIKSDIGAAAVTVAASTSLTYANLTALFGSVKRGTNLKVYSSRARKYGDVLGMVDTAKQPVLRDGVLMNEADYREDAAAGDDIFVLDPKKFVLNVVQDTMIETDRDIKNHKIIISGYVRAEGCMRDNGAGAYATFA